MKKSTLLMTILLACGAFASCLRSDDLEMLRHPIHVTGSVDPQYGVPVATGEMNINDLLSHLSAEYQGIIADDEEVLIVEYQTTMRDTIHAFSELSFAGAPSHNSLPTKDLSWFSKDTTFYDTIDIDFFNDVDFYNQLEMEHIWVDLRVGAFIEGDTSIFRHLKGTFKDLVIKYEDHDSVLRTYSGLNVDPIVIENMADGFEHGFERIDVASIANDMPRRIIAQYKFTFSVSSQLITQQITNMHFGEILDSIHSSRLVYSADFSVSMPLSILFNNLSYTYDLDLGDGLSSVNLDSILSYIHDGISVEIDTSRVRMVFDNGIPVEFTVSAVMQDADGNDLITLFQNANIASANVSTDPSGNYVASSSVKTTVETMLVNSDLDKLDRAKNIHLTMRTDTDNKHVTMRRSDFLKIKAYLQVKPSVDVDIPITDNGIL